jgi:hypothetical protein
MMGITAFVVSFIVNMNYPEEYHLLGYNAL